MRSTYDFFNIFLNIVGYNDDIKKREERERERGRLIVNTKLFKREGGR